LSERPFTSWAAERRRSRCLVCHCKGNGSTSKVNDQITTRQVLYAARQKYIPSENSHRFVFSLSPDILLSNSDPIIFDFIDIGRNLGTTENYVQRHLLDEHDDACNIPRCRGTRNPGYRPSHIPGPECFFGMRSMRSTMGSISNLPGVPCVPSMLKCTHHGTILILQVPRSCQIPRVNITSKVNKTLLCTCCLSPFSLATLEFVFFLSLILAEKAPLTPITRLTEDFVSEKQEKWPAFIDLPPKKATRQAKAEIQATMGFTQQRLRLAMFL
jgi:hypothetical protein